VVVVVVAGCCEGKGGSCEFSDFFLLLPPIPLPLPPPPPLLPPPPVWPFDVIDEITVVVLPGTREENEENEEGGVI